MPVYGTAMRWMATPSALSGCLPFYLPPENGASRPQAQATSRTPNFVSVACRSSSLLPMVYLEVGIVHLVGRRDGDRRPVRLPQPRHGDGVRPGAVRPLQVVGVHQHGHHLVLVVRQAEQRADAHVVQPSTHGAVVREQAVVVVGLGAREVHLRERRPVVRLLEQGVRPHLPPPNVLGVAKS
eukprot:8762364-Pyramimonas_sp.AAC.1